jgi:hypothetical protein
LVAAQQNFYSKFAQLQKQLSVIKLQEQIKQDIKQASQDALRQQSEQEQLKSIEFLQSIPAFVKPEIKELAPHGRVDLDSLRELPVVNVLELVEKYSFDEFKYVQSIDVGGMRVCIMKTLQKCLKVLDKVERVQTFTS